MGILSWLFGWDAFKAANNALLAHHLLENLDSESVSMLKRRAVEISMRTRYKQGPEIEKSVIEMLNRSNRVHQMTMIALAAEELGYAPLVKHEFWNFSKRPLVAAGQVSDDRMEGLCVITKRNNGVDIQWPGNESRIHFS